VAAHPTIRTTQSAKGDQFQPRQALDDVTQQRRSLPHDADRIERQQSLNDRLRAGHMVIENRDFGPISNGRPVRHLQRDILIIIEDRDFHDLGTLRLLW
jgi:hypothetical protein